MIIKICGMREPDNIAAVEALQVDWMGFICWAGSPRYVATTPAHMPASPVRRVGVFVNPAMQVIKERAREFGLHIIQLHGNESPAFCLEVRAATGLPVIKAFAIRTSADLDAINVYLPTSSPSTQQYADYFLFDTKSPLVGGSGQQFDWRLLDNYRGPVPFLLSGGISPTDATRLRAFRHPQCLGFDLNSRFETAPAVKDTSALAAFINAVRS